MSCLLLALVLQLTCMTTRDCASINSESCAKFHFFDGIENRCVHCELVCQPHQVAESDFCTNNCHEYYESMVNSPAEFSTSTRRLHVPDVPESSPATTQVPLSPAINLPNDLNNQTITFTIIFAIGIAAISIFIALVTLIVVSVYCYWRHRVDSGREGKDHLLSSKLRTSSSCESSFGKQSDSSTQQSVKADTVHHTMESCTMVADDRVSPG